MATELRFPVEIDDSQAAKELNKLESKIGKLKDSIAKAESSRTPIVEQLKEAQDAAVKAYARVEELKAALAESEYKTSPEGITDPDTFYAELQRQSEIKAEIAAQEKIMQAKEQEAQKLEAADTKILTSLKDPTAELEKAQARAGELTKQITDASKGKDIKAAFESASASLKSGTKNILKWGAGITGLVVLARRLRTYIIEAVKSFAENDPETKANIDSLKASLAGLKASWGAAFAPVLNAVVPVLQTLISWLTAAANAVAQFFAVLSGKGTFKKAIANTGKLSSNLGGAADNAKEAKKQLMGIDTLNVMNDTNTGSGGGSGGGNDALDWVEEAVNMDSFAGKLALSFKDVFLDWNDLTGEQIAEKIIAGLAGLAGGVMGFMIGGVPGAIVGTLAGLAIGLVADSLIFDHDGKLSANEIFKSLLLLLMGVAGGLIGFSLGGVAGAAIGATVGVALALAVRDVGVEAMNTWSSMNLLEKILVFLGGLVGGAIGFAIGGPLGAVLGATIGIGLMLVAKNVDLSDVGAKLKEGGDTILEKLKEIGDGIAAKWSDIKKDTAAKWDGIKTDLSTKIAAVKSVLDGLINKAASVKDALVNKFENMRSALSGIVDRIKNLFNFQFQLPQLRLPHIQVQWQDAGALAQFFGLTKIPHLSVAWYARGGIVDGATLIGAGEAGKEAIVPLERNTQWVTMVANELADIMFDRMTDKFAGLNMRMPAVAGGFVVPPNAFSSGGYGAGISPELESKIDALLDRLNGNNRPIEVRTTVELDKRKVGEAVYTYTEERNRGRGK